MDEEHQNDTATAAATGATDQARPRRGDGALVLELVIASGAVSALTIASLMSWWRGELRVAAWTGAGALIVLAWMTGRVLAVSRRDEPANEQSARQTLPSAAVAHDVNATAEP